MRTGKDLILATKPFARDSVLRSWWVIASTLCLLALSFVLADRHHDGLAGRAVCSVLAGMLFLRLFIIYHDQQHGAILPKSRLAAAIMSLVGILLLSPTSIWTSSHNHHHRHNSKLRGSHIGSFPVMTKANFEGSSRFERFTYLFMRHSLTILFGYVFVFLYGMCLYPFFDKPREHVDCLIAFLIHAIIASILFWFLGVEGWFFGQALPCFISGAIGSYLFYAQHNFPEVSFYDNAGWTYEKAALESSSFMKTGVLMAWFTANIGYHHIHHLNSRIPFYRLPEAFTRIPELRNPKATSLHPFDIIRCLRLKVWDVKNQRMVGLPWRAIIAPARQPEKSGSAQ
jgi:acyl-lipid omega-6 desaturase (Delta-12 desaturase)